MNIEEATVKQYNVTFNEDELCHVVNILNTVLGADCVAYEEDTKYYLTNDATSKVWNMTRIMRKHADPDHQFTFKAEVI